MRQQGDAAGPGHDRAVDLAVGDGGAGGRLVGVDVHVERVAALGELALDRGGRLGRPGDALHAGRAG
jgi:hypothetical protein